MTEAEREQKLIEQSQEEIDDERFRINREKVQHEFWRLYFEKENLRLNQRREILQFVKRYILWSSLIVLGIFLVSSTLNLWSHTQMLIDNWTVRVMMGGVITQFIGVLAVIARGVFSPKH